MEELYRYFSKVVRFYLCRQTGSPDLEDLVHDLFAMIVEAIQRGDIREPERLMGFVRTAATRQGYAYIRRVAKKRRQEIDIESERDISAVTHDPEQAAIITQRERLIALVLDELSDRDREVLVRFYLLEQDSIQISFAMGLTETQFRLLKSRAKSRFGQLGKRKLCPPLPLKESVRRIPT
jgi:RNA polymerase sigma factor (sigma-70 family)